MKRLFNILLVSCIAMAGVSCSSDTALIDAGIAGAQDKDVVIKKLEVNREIVLDTIRADAKGNVSYRYSFSDRNPEFIYLYYGNRRLGSFCSLLTRQSLEYCNFCSLTFQTTC